METVRQNRNDGRQEKSRQIRRHYIKIYEKVSYKDIEKLGRLKKQEKN
jgi:hypothetical protein